MPELLYLLCSVASPHHALDHPPSCKDVKSFLLVQDAERELHQLLQCMREEGGQQEVEDDWLLALAEAAGPDSQRWLSSSQQVPLLLEKACCVTTTHCALHLAKQCNAARQKRQPPPLSRPAPPHTPCSNRPPSQPGSLVQVCEQHHPGTPCAPLCF